ncbi:MAG: ACT domain-containing protein, partial [Chloroflexota bacterium]
VAAEGINIATVSSTDSGDTTRAIHTIRLILGIQDIEQLGRTLTRIESVKGVINAMRSSDRR